MNKVWIELERPTPDESDEVAHTRAELGTKVLQKLGLEHGKFAWFPDKRKYVFVYNESGGFVYLNDNGDWFNLDWAAK